MIFQTKHDGFLKDMEVLNYSPYSVLKYGHCVKMFLAFLEEKGVTDLRNVGRDLLLEYRQRLQLNTTYSPSYVGSNIRAIKLFFKFLMKTGVILYNFAVILKEPKMPKALPKEPLTATEVKAMLNAPDLRTELGIRDRAIMETFYSSGLRVQEMSRLKLTDLNVEEGFLFVREGKGKKDRYVPLGEHACFFIKTYLEKVRPVLESKAKGIRLKPEDKVITLKTNQLWLTRNGQPIRKMDLVNMISKHRKRAGITKQVTAHSFRRTMAVELIRNDADFLTVKAILGHSQSSVTLRYLALSGVELTEALKKSHPRYDLDKDDVEDATPHIERIG